MVPVDLRFQTAIADLHFYVTFVWTRYHAPYHSTGNTCIAMECHECDTISGCVHTNVT